MSARHRRFGSRSSALRIGLIAHHVAAIRPPFVGGVESFTWYLARWLAGRGHDVVLYAAPGSSVPGVEVEELDLEPELSEAARSDVSMPPEAFMRAHHAYQRLMLELAESTRHDLVHAHSLHYLPVAMAPMLHVPMLLTLHCPPTPWLESALRARRSGAAPTLSAVSEATRRLWAEVVDCPDVVPNGVDIDAWPSGPGGDAAVWSGRIVPEKAPHLAIDAARRAGLSLRLAGPIVDHAYYAAEVEPRLGSDAVHLGHLSHEALAALVGASRVAIVSSVWNEPFGLVAAEAMATGTPVAGFAVGGLPRVVGCEGGVLVEQGNVEALAAAVRAASSLDRCRVRAHAESVAGIEAMGRRYEALYERALEPAPVLRLGRTVRPALRVASVTP